MFNHIKKATGYSMAGLRAAIQDEKAVRLVLLQAFFVIIFILFFSLPYTQKAFLLISAFLCIAVELINSAMENIVDLVTTDWHILAKKAKDMGSAAQFIALTSLYTQILLIILENI
jgi:diacylglycerol kinase (ATP)